MIPLVNAELPFRHHLEAIVERTIATLDAQRDFEQIVKDVGKSGEAVVVQRDGTSLVAVVPFRLYEQWKKHDAAFFELPAEAARRANLTPEEADALAAEAVQAVRASYRSG